MSDKEILQKALFKAGMVLPVWVFQNKEGELVHYEGVIFSHQFARAFFKDLEWEWTHYLQEMALQENRISYLAKFL